MSDRNSQGSSDKDSQGGSHEGSHGSNKGSHGSQGSSQGGSDKSSHGGNQGGSHDGSHGSNKGSHGSQGSSQGGSDKSSHGGNQGDSQGGNEEIHEGDRVAVNIGQNILEGSVTGVLTHPEVIDGRVAHASEDSPRYAVKIDSTGTEIIRTEDGITRLESDEESGKVNVGDRVAFHVGQNRLEGTVTQIMTSPTEVEGRVAHATKDDPRYAVQYDGTGKESIRTEESIEKIDEENQESNEQGSNEDNKMETEGAKRKREDEEESKGKSSGGGKKGEKKGGGEPETKRKRSNKANS